MNSAVRRFQLNFMLVKIKTKNYFSFGLLLLSALILTMSSLNVVAQNKSDSEIVVTIQRTACFGACPVYSAQIYADGTVIYDGKDFVKITGKKQHKISEDRVRELLKAFEQVTHLTQRGEIDLSF